MEDKSKVIGKALYLELRSSFQTYQILITPDGITSEGRPVPSMMYRRQISESRPRRAWRHTGLGNTRMSADGVFELMSVQEANDYADSRLQMLHPLFDQIKRYNYTVYKAPLVVEVTVEDLDAVRKGATPYKILGRVTRSRKAAGFEDSFFKVG